MDAQTRSEETTSRAPAEAGWASRLSLRPSSQFDEGPGLPDGLRPSGNLVRTVALCCVLALAAVALRGLAVGSGQSTAPGAAGVADP